MKIYMVCPITQGDHKQTHSKLNMPHTTVWWDKKEEYLDIHLQLTIHLSTRSG